MSTKGTIAQISHTEDVGGEEYHASLELYDDCFDDDPAPVYIEVMEQGVFNNHGGGFVVSREEALAFADQLTKWAASVRKFKKETP